MAVLVRVELDPCLEWDLSVMYLVWVPANGGLKLNREWGLAGRSFSAPLRALTLWSLKKPPSSWGCCEALAFSSVLLPLATVGSEKERALLEDHGTVSAGSISTL